MSDLVQQQPSAAPPRARVSLRARAALALGAVVATVLGAEVLIAALVPRDRFFSASRMDEFVGTAAMAAGTLVADAELGHLPVLDGVTYDRFGIVRDRLGGDGEDKARRVLFVGDSVTRRGRIVRAVAARCPDVACWNAGVEAWSPVQEVPMYFRASRAARPTQVVLTLHNNDFSATPVGLMTERGFTVCMPGVLAAFDPVWYRWSRLYRLWVAAQNRGLAEQGGYLRHVDAVRAALRELRDGLAADGTGLCVLVLPILQPLADWSADEVAARERALAICAELGLRTIDLLPPLQQLLAADADVLERPRDYWHPNDLAAAMFADAALRAGLLDGGAAAAAASDRCLVSAAAGATQALQIDVGERFAGCGYRVLGSASGCFPGVTPGGISVRLNADDYAAAVFARPGDVMDAGDGVLDAAGRATVHIRGALAQDGAPRLLHHAVLVLNRARGRVATATNPVPIIVAR